MRRNGGRGGVGRWPSCPGCSTPNRPGARFCPRCGADLSDPDAQPVLPAADRRESPARSRSTSESIEYAEGRRLWRLFRSVLWFYLIILAIIGGVSLFFRVIGNTSPWIDVVATSLLALITLAFVMTEGRSIAILLGRGHIGAGGGVLFLGALAGLYLFMTVYFRALHGLGVESMEYLTNFREHGWPLWTAFVLIAVCPGVLEELAFRGYMQGRLERIVEPGEAILIQAVLFSVVHLNPLTFVSHFVMGWVLGWLRRRTKSLYPGMLLHGTWNALVLLEELGFPSLL